MITTDTYIERVLHNTIEYHRQEKENCFDLKKYHGFDAPAGTVPRWVLASKTYDILSSVILGFLPILVTKTGTDAIRLVNDNFKSVELKSSYADESKFIKTENNTIYSATANKIVDGKINKNNTTLLKSNYNASYEIAKNIDVKNLDTFLLINDSRNDILVDCFVIEGDVMIEYLKSREIPESGKVTIKLTKFEELGKKFTGSIIGVPGFETWSKSLLPDLQTVHVMQPAQFDLWNMQRVSSQFQHFFDLPKTDPIEQTPNLCIEEID